MEKKMDNTEYVDSLRIGNEKDRRKMLETLEKYGDDKWWLSKDNIEIAYYQLNEPIFIAPDFEEFRKGVETLLGRLVDIEEFGLNRKELAEEAKKAWRKIQKEETVSGVNELVKDADRQKTKGALETNNLPVCCVMHHIIIIEKDNF